jgi:hypothetical protein
MISNPHIDYHQKLADDFSIEIVRSSHFARFEVEEFIKKSYQKNFSAQLDSFFPKILTLRDRQNNQLVAAVGIRNAARENLFSECYLEQSVEQTICTIEKTLTARSKIIELGNFVVTDKKEIPSVILALGKFIKSMDVDWALYTLTRPIKKYFERLCIDLTFINEASIEKINGAAKNWGRYYNFKPAVYYSSVNTNLN